MEATLIKDGKAPTHGMTLDWLEKCADKWHNDSQVYANRRGFTLYDEDSLVTRIEGQKYEPN